MVKIFSSEENWICLLSETKRESICHEFATELTFLEISPVVMMNREIKYGQEYPSLVTLPAGENVNNFAILSFSFQRDICTLLLRINCCSS